MNAEQIPLLQDELHTYQLHQQVLRIAGYAIITFNRHGILIYASDTLPQIIGYTLDDIIGRHYDDLLNIFVPNGYTPHYNDFEDEFLAQQVLPHVIITKNGEKKWIEYQIIPYHEDDYIHALIQDVTSRCLAEQAIEQQIQESARQYQEIQNLFEKVNRLEQLKSDMIRMAAHDLRAPLAVFVTHLDVLSLELADEKAIIDKRVLSERLDDLRNATKRMKRIIEDILSLERIEQNAHHAEYTPIEIAPIVQGLFRDYQPQAKSKSLDFNLKCLPKPVFILGDIAQLREAIANLISNAIKYTPEGGHVDIWMDVKNDCVHFEVIDSGYGIPKDKQASLFQPFYRAKSKATRHIEGTGLGLYLVKNVIERHRGRLIFKSVEGKGSHFGFEIPLIQQ